MQDKEMQELKSLFGLLLKKQLPVTFLTNTSDFF